MLVYVQSILTFVLCLYTTITDIKNKKIYNKVVLIAVLASTAVYVVLYKQIEIYYITNQIINSIITLVISFLFFYFKIWAAGDAKLFWAISYILPFSIYEANEKNVFPSMYLLIMIFGVAFIYVAIETIYLWMQDKKKFSNIRINKINKSSWIDFIIHYFCAYFLILFINNIICKFFEDFNKYNGVLLIICNMLFITFLYRAISKRKNYIIITVFAIIFNVIYILLFGFILHPINLKMMFIIILLLMFRKISEKYNYETIKVSNLKPGMILAFETVIMFFTSKVKGLPKRTTETTDSRLTIEEIESIKRWSKTAKGKDEIVIVKHMPFAPFMFVGTTIYLIIKVIL